MKGMRKRDIVEAICPFALHVSQLHGVAHWARVARFGEALAEKSNLTPEFMDCVSVFAWTHDLARIDDTEGTEHAINGAAYLEEVASSVFPFLSENQLALIRTSIHYHSHGYRAEEAVYQGWFDGIEGDQTMVVSTIGCCWDADRLDLLRLGYEPDPYRMSTRFWIEVLPLSRKLNGET